MTRILPFLGQLASPLGLALIPSIAAAQGPGSGGSREAMWPAPTAEDWARPCLITWQRTFEDALVVARETGKPILVCVNMDGEIASEHYAGVRYRQAEIAALYDPYVTVIASVYRHNPRDHDERGQRILCPRFGSVTCGEHIAIEPGLFQQFFDGQRVAPRHIGVELDRQEMYDVFYAWDTDTIFDALREGIANRPTVPSKMLSSDRSIVERVTSRDSQDRTAVENAYLQGDRALRLSLLQAGLASGDAVPVELLRLALFGFDSELSRLARRALAQSSSEGAIDLILETLRLPLEVAERDGLIAALARLGESSPRARTLAAVHRGLTRRSSMIDVEGWGAALEDDGSPIPASDRSVLEWQLETLTEVSRARPDDAAAQLELAEASLALAVDPQTARSLAADPRTTTRYARLMFQDVRRAALRAEELGARGWRVSAALALAAYYLGDRQEAHLRAEAAVSGMPPGERGWNAMAVLGLFAQARRQSIVAAVRDKKAWPAEWLTEMHAAYSVLARHPLGSDSQVVAHHDFLKWLGAGGGAAQVLDEGLARFPESWVLHDRLRGRILEERGLAGLEADYEARLRATDAPANLEWFAGYTSLVAAEFYRRSGDEEQALAAYERAIAHYERAIEANADSGDSADHYIALALASRARLAYERGDDEGALEGLLASFERKPSAAGSPDGLGISPVATARMLLARLTEGQREGLADKLEQALEGLDPELLALPSSERLGPGGSSRARRPTRRRDSRGGGR